MTLWELPVSLQFQGLYRTGMVHTYKLLKTYPLKPSVSCTNTSVIVIFCSVDVIAGILERLSDDAEPK